MTILLRIQFLNLIINRISVPHTRNLQNHDCDARKFLSNSFVIKPLQRNVNIRSQRIGFFSLKNFQLNRNEEGSMENGIQKNIS